MVIRVGIIGLSEGNGHPFSFSAIINGYDAHAFEQAGWPVILNYLKLQPETSFGFPEVRVTHAWTQDKDVTAKLCAACRIRCAVETPADMLGKIDALIIARDDWECHAALARPFLEAGVAVFIDKPLSLDTGEIAWFRRYLENGQLMSTSGLRYAAEFEGLRTKIQAMGQPRLVCATVLNGIEKYGIHMLDAVDGLGLSPPVTITRLEAQHQAFHLTLADGCSMVLNCLGNVGRTFHLSVFCERGHAHVDLHDNFSAFRSTLALFIEMVRTRQPVIEPSRVVDTMTLIRQALSMSACTPARVGHE